MIVDNLKARCVDVVARELARSVYRRRETIDTDAWFAAVESCRSEAAEKINKMSNMELLDVIAEVLVED